MSWQNTKIAKAGTHHTINTLPIYEQRFISVLKFHAPGLAPVTDRTGSYHITVDGEATYSQRFVRTFGYYQGRATAIDKSNWIHILPDGSLLSENKFAWSGNFQYNRCPVRGQDMMYFHVNLDGNRTYAENYLYCGDFKDDYAVIRLGNGLCTHINQDGEKLHEMYFYDLDIFHKGFARAKDKTGWFHILESGEAAYQFRFKNVEPFYNGFALSETLSGNTVIIDEQGEEVHKVCERNY